MASPPSSPAQKGAAGPKKRLGGRSERVRRAVLDATVRLLVEGGFERLVIAEVAAASGVHETSIYRRWGTRERLAIEALLTHAEERVEIPDTGALRTDLVRLLRAVLAVLTSPHGRALARFVVGGNDSRLRRVFWLRRCDAVTPIFRRAIERGELRAGADPIFALELAIAPLYLRLLITDQPLKSDLPERIADAVLDGLGARRKPVLRNR